MRERGGALCLVLAAAGTVFAGAGASRFFAFDLTASPALADVEVPRTARVAGRAGTAASDPGGRTGRSRDGVTAPRLISKVEPKYTDEARSAKLEGVVVVETVISQKGAPEQVRVVKGLGAGLDESAVEAVRHWGFKPALKNGKPVRARTRIEVHFELK